MALRINCKMWKQISDCIKFRKTTHKQDLKKLYSQKGCQWAYENAQSLQFIWPLRSTNDHFNNDSSLVWHLIPRRSIGQITNRPSIIDYIRYKIAYHIILGGVIDDLIDTGQYSYWEIGEILGQRKFWIEFLGRRKLNWVTSALIRQV